MAPHHNAWLDYAIDLLRGIPGTVGPHWMSGGLSGKALTLRYSAWSKGSGALALNDALRLGNRHKITLQVFMVEGESEGVNFRRKRPSLTAWLQAKTAHTISTEDLLRCA